MRKHKIAIAALLLLIVIYLLQTFLPAPDAASLDKYKLTATSARALTLTFVIPLIAIWSIAMYGYIRFSSYASSIRRTPEGGALKELSHGLLALALWVPVYAIIQNASRELALRFPGLTEEIVITTNFLHVIFLLVVGYLLWRGSRYLLRVGNIVASSINRTHLYITTGAFAFTYGYLILLNPARFSPPENPLAAFYLPAWLLVTLIIIPYAAVWYLGLEAVQNIYAYRNRVKGIIYKKALGYAAYGIAFAVISALTLRTLAGLTAWMDELTLKLVLIMIYGLVIMIGIGYVLIWLGAKKLQLIEEV